MLTFQQVRQMLNSTGLMHFLRIWIRNVLGFSGRETNGFLILLPLILIIIFSEPVYRVWVVSHDRPDLTQQYKLDSLVALFKNKPERKPLATAKKTERKLFRFDPNIASIEDLIALGFPEKIAKRVATYRQKGGRFKTTSDLMKLYGMDSVLFNSLKAYVEIAPQAGQSAKQPDKVAFQSQKPRLSPFDINEADTVTLKSVYGIGTKLAERISKFRSGLGGFVSLNQLSEIYGLDTAVVSRLKKRAFIKDEFVPKKINLNTTTETDMSAHPYISKSAAKAIVAWRFQHGPFHDVNEIKNLTLLKSEDIVKIIPYLTVKE
jgi:competence protein ComEA